MKELIELVSTITNNKVVNIDFMHDDVDESKSGLFFEGLKNGKIRDELSARRYIYADAPVSEAAFKKLKSRLKEKLFNTVLLIQLDDDGSSKIRVHIMDGHKLAAAKVLMVLYNYSAASELAKSVLKKAERYEITEHIISASRVLLKVAAIKGKRKDFLHYTRLQEETEYTYFAISKARNFYHRIILETNLSSNVGQEFISELEQFCLMLESDLEKVHSFEFRRLCCLLKITFFHLKYDYLGLAQEGEKQLDYFEKHYPSNSDGVYSSIYVQMISAYIQLNKLEDAKVYIDKCLGFLTTGSRTWFAVQKLNFIYLFRSKRYQSAFDLYLATSKNKKFDTQYENDKELWRLFEAYLNFLGNAGIVDLSIGAGQKSKRKFRLGRFLNEVPSFSKDKKGMNVAITIIHILFLLAKKDYGKVIDRVDSIKQYGMRYLRTSSTTYRSDCFIKMLLLLPTAEFHQERVAHRSKALLSKLSQSPINAAEQSTEVEIIPYEELWQLILDQLPSKVVRPKNQKAS